MSKRCAKCEKAVYPIEELKCLDKIWHKACFRCWECNMALNMKNYKGYDKKPYCNAHYPTTKYTAVAETPEMARIASNTKMQSQIQYHEDFEKNKSKFTVVTDDPETRRLKQNTQNISLINYHADFEKNIKGSKIQVADDPETLRIKASSAVISQVEYKGLREKASVMEERRGNIPQNTDAGPISRPSGKISDYDPTRVGGVKMTGPAPEEYNASPASSKNVGHSTIYNQQGKVEQAGSKRVGSISDYDPLNQQFGSLTSGYAPSSTMRQRQEWEESYPEPQPQNHAPPHVNAAPEYQESRSARPPSPEPPQPATNPPSSMYPQSAYPNHPEHYPAPQHSAPPQQYVTPTQHQAPPPSHQMAPPPSHQMAPPPEPQAPIQPPPPQPEPVAPPPAPASSNVVYQAIYDYEAQDDDEIAFIENDLIIDCQSIDDGWMFGTVRRTGLRGMLPANYVERVQ